MSLNRSLSISIWSDSGKAVWREAKHPQWWIPRKRHDGVRVLWSTCLMWITTFDRISAETDRFHSRSVASESEGCSKNSSDTDSTQVQRHFYASSFITYYSRLGRITESSGLSKTPKKKKKTFWKVFFRVTFVWNAVCSQCSGGGNM